MSDKRKLLVVDDEAVICQACRRVFSRQGFKVEESTNAREGLNLATASDYAAILLDIKMPEMNGIEFLEALRQKKPDVPVMIMTGYPSIPNAAAAVRLGASEYITKPFTPEEITQAVQRMLARRDTIQQAEAGPPPPEVESRGPGEGEFLFLDESWIQLEPDGSASVGAVLPRSRGASAQAVRLPRIGEVIYQGLPLAGLAGSDESLSLVPSPVSGVVVAVNELLAHDPSLLLNDPCGRGWIACICTTRFEEEVNHCKVRRVILANADEASACNQREQLTSLGCQVRVVKDLVEEELVPAVEAPDDSVLLFDAASFGERGPELVGRVNAKMPSLRVVVVASSASRWEAGYREQGIFYYAVEPFADKEIVDILDAAFRPQGQPRPEAELGKAPPEPVKSICVTNRNGHKVHLLVEPGLLWRNAGLGWQINHKLIDRRFPVATAPGNAEITPTEILKTASTCDRLMLLRAKDTGRLPGTLARDTKPEFASESEQSEGKVTTLMVQPDSTEGGFSGFDRRTTGALAEHIVQEMASY